MERQRTVLVVEDDPHIRKLISSIADRAGFRSAVASTAREALDAARTSRPAVITMDDTLEGEDGLAAIAFFRQDPATAEIPVIAVMSPFQRYRVTEAGCVAFVEKPFGGTELAVALQERAR